MRGWPFAVAKHCKAEVVQMPQQDLLQIEKALGDAIDPDAEQQLERGLQSIDADKVWRARFVALRCGHEADLILGDKGWAVDIPRAEQCRPASPEMLLLHHHDALRARTEEPLVGIGTEEVDVLRIEGKGAQRLDAIVPPGATSLDGAGATAAQTAPVA